MEVSMFGTLDLQAMWDILHNITESIGVNCVMSLSALFSFSNHTFIFTRTWHELYWLSAGRIDHLIFFFSVYMSKIWQSRPVTCE